MSETWDPEAWAWKQIRSGRVADFNAHFRKTLDPREAEGWGDDRKLGSGFLRRLFFEPPYRDEIPPEGVRVVGAYLPDGQVLSQVKVPRQVRLDQCRSEAQVDFSGTTIPGWLSFDDSFLGNTADSPSVNLEAAHIEGGVKFRSIIAKGEVVLANAKIDGRLNMIGSIFTQKVNGNGMQVGRSVHMRDKATFNGEVILANAKIGGQIDMSGSTFAKVNADNLQVRQGFYMRKAKFNGEVILLNAKIDGQLDMNGSTFAQKVDADNLQVSKDLLMSDSATFARKVILANAKIGGQLAMDDSSFAQTVNSENLYARDLFLRDSSVEGASFLFARIDGSIDLRGATCTSLDLAGVRITGQLILADEKSVLNWRSPVDPVFNLRNATAGALQDSLAAWPASIDLEGFSYTHLGGFGAKGLNDARNRPVDEWIAWLAKDGGNAHRFSPRPYTQLASVLVAAGRRDQANAILFAGRKRERQEAWREGRWGQWFWLIILSGVCGYGIGSYTFRVLWWILGSAAAGMIVLYRFVPAAHAKGVWWCGLASLDRLLPVIQLNKQFSDFFANAHGENLPTWVIVSYAGLGLWGWILGGFLIAAVSGLIQKT